MKVVKIYVNGNLIEGNTANLQKGDIICAWEEITPKPRYLNLQPEPTKAKYPSYEEGLK